jgi:hypothetical protein
MATTGAVQLASTVGGSFTIIEYILRDRNHFWLQIHEEQQIGTLIRQMLISSSGALACYGAVLGFSHSWLQAISSAIKLPVLFLLTLLICLPTLYLFNLIFGSKLSMQQALAMVLAAITVTSMMTLAFAPISLFFLISAPNYDFFKLLNVVIFVLTGFIGLRFLTNGMKQINELVARATQPAVPAPEEEVQIIEVKNSAATKIAPLEQPVNTTLLKIWVVLYCFVGTQLGWTLRPFFGSPDYPFEIFRAIEGNFYVDIMMTIQNFFR